jgi:hypothetical protein
MRYKLSEWPFGDRPTSATALARRATASANSNTLTAFNQSASSHALSPIARRFRDFWEHA